MASEPLFHPIVVLAVPARSNVGIETRAEDPEDERECDTGPNSTRKEIGYSLELRAVVVLRTAFSNEARTRGAHPQHPPVLLEDTKVGSVAGLVVTLFGLERRTI